MFGLSASVLGGLLGASPVSAATRRLEAVKAGGTLRVAILAPTKPPEPSQVADEGGLGVISVVGEFLTFSDPQLNLKPWLATSWKPNKTATRLDVPDPQGRQVPQRPDDDGRRRRRRRSRC